MKKYSILFFGLLALACTREADEQTDAPERMILSGFTASMPGAEDPSVKTMMVMDPSGQGNVVWTTDDPVFVSNGAESMTMFVEEGGTTRAALYSEQETIEGTDFFAVYPAEGAWYEGGIFTASIPGSQKYVPGGFSTEVFPMVALCDSRRNFAFRNAASLLKLTTVSSAPLLQRSRISSITVSATEPLSGTVHVNYSEGKEPETDCSGGNSVTINADGEGIAFGEPVFATLAPGDYSNVTVRVLLQNGLAFQYTYPGRLSLLRSAYKSIEVPLEDDFTDISAEATANCYMITEPGSYKFKATVRGNGVETSACGESGISAEFEDGAAVKVYYSDGDPFLEGTFSIIDGYIYFTTTETFQSGTALVSVVDASDNTLWSWHIWANREIEDVELSNGQTWLNMNLGALHKGFSNDGYNGFYYQWGRKDPFLQKYTSGTAPADLSPFVSRASGTEGSLVNSILNPHVFYGGYHPSGVSITTEDWCTYEDDVKIYDWWNASCTGDDQKELACVKTMFDPCPAGYHVPVYSEVKSIMDLPTGAWSNGKSVENVLFFPASSYRYVNIYADYWISGAPRAFFWCSTPLRTEQKNNRRGYRPYFVSTSQGIGNGPRTYAIPVRCIKDSEPDHGTVIGGDDPEGFEPEEW